MQADRRQFWLAVTTLIGSIIGVGIFGIPYAFSRIGLLPALAYVVVLGGIQLLQHLFYTEAAIACPEKLRLAGLAGKYLGPRARVAATISTVLGFWGGMLAYVIVGGTFLHALLSPFLGGRVFTYQVAWMIVAATVVYFGLDVASRVSFFATIGLMTAGAVIFVIGGPHVRLANMPLVTGLDWMLPYGVILFSLSGLPAILEMEDILKGEHKYYRQAVITGTLAAAALTTTFGLVVWGITGAAVTNDTVTGLRSALGPGIATAVAVLGFFSVTTAFLAVSINLQSTFRYDYKLPKVTGWLLTIGPPFGAFLLGAKDFVRIIGFSGAVFGGITAALVALLYVAVTKGEKVKGPALGLPVWLAYVTITILSSGALLEAGTTAMQIVREMK